MFGIVPKKIADEEYLTSNDGMNIPETAMANWIASYLPEARANFIETDASLRLGENDDPDKYLVFGTVNIPINNNKAHTKLTLINKETANLAIMHPGRMVYYTTAERDGETLFFPFESLSGVPANCEYGAVKDVSSDIIKLVEIIAEVFEIDRIPYFITFGTIRYLVNDNAEEPEILRKRGARGTPLRIPGAAAIVDNPTHVFQVTVRGSVVFSSLSEESAIRYVEENKPKIVSYELE